MRAIALCRTSWACGTPCGRSVCRGSTGSYRGGMPFTMRPLHPDVQHARHALALDEDRATFLPEALGRARGGSRLGPDQASLVSRGALRYRWRLPGGGALRSGARVDDRPGDHRPESGDRRFDAIEPALLASRHAARRAGWAWARCGSRARASICDPSLSSARITSSGASSSRACPPSAVRGRIARSARQAPGLREVLRGHHRGASRPLAAARATLVTNRWKVAPPVGRARP